MKRAGDMVAAEADLLADLESNGDVSAPEEDNAARFAAALGLRFRDLDLLRLALTHRSVGHDLAAAPPGFTRRSNERLEFLGDAILGAIVAEELYHRFPEASEGTLTARRVALVRAEQLVRWAREINLGDYLYLGQGERISESARDRVLAGAFEALVGAIALDRGMREAKRFLRRFLVRDVDRVVAEQEQANPKGRLQELLQEHYRQTPAYRIVRIEGPAHARLFTAEVALGGKPLAIGVGASKREAEQAAASAALARLLREADGLEAGWAEPAQDKVP